MNVIVAFLIASWVFGSFIFSIFSRQQGYTHFDIYNQRKYGITPDRSNDAEETVYFDTESTLDKPDEPEDETENN